MYKLLKKFLHYIFIDENNDIFDDNDIFNNKIINIEISNNMNISIQSANVEKTPIRKDLFDKNYYFKYLFTDNNEYKFNSLKEAVNKNHIIYKKNLVKNSLKLFKNIYLNNDKIYKYCYYNNKSDYLHIIRYLKNNKVPNIILPEEIYEEISSTPSLNEKKILQIFPYKKYGDLFTHVTSNKLKYHEIYSIYYKLVKIIKDLHKIQVSHRDIKLENVLVDFSPNLELYLIDFEFTTHYSDYSNFNGGTEMYAAPELFSKSNKIIDYKCVDIWALGVILYILIFNILPWKIAIPNICGHYYNFITYPCNFYNILNTVNIPITHKLIYTNILKYCFNLNYNKRIDINNIFKLL
jgi:serine/threonine protein kinase